MSIVQVLEGDVAMCAAGAEGGGDIAKVDWAACSVRMGGATVLAVSPEHQVGRSSRGVPKVF